MTPPSYGGHPSQCGPAPSFLRPPGGGLGRGAWTESARLHPRDHIETLASELDFWTKNRSISVSSGGKSYILNHYEVPYGGPR